VANLKAAQINTATEQGAVLSFSAEVFPDGDIDKVAEHDKQLEKDQAGSDVRGTRSSPHVYLRHIRSSC